LAAPTRRRHTPWMHPMPGAPLRVLIVASAPLLRVGLERAILAAGLQPTSDKADAAIGLYSADTAPPGTSMDLCVGANHVAITLTSIPELQTWSAAWALLPELFDAVVPPA
jgi:hypothetical protein